jgi:hypothetical protein
LVDFGRCTTDGSFFSSLLGNFRGYESLRNRICSECNGKCTTLDEQLCRSAGESFFREYLGIKGRATHQKVRPFYRRSAGGGRLVMEGTSAETGKRVELELANGNVRELRHLALTTESGERFTIPIPDGMTPEKLKKEFDRLGIKKAKEGYVFADKEEIPWIESLLDTLKIDSRLEWMSGGADTVTYSSVVITFTVTEKYFRALAKIGFHYFLTKMRDFRGDEPCFAGIREFIMNEGDLKRCDRFVRCDPRYLIFHGMRPAAWGHIVTAESDYHSLRSRIQLFLGPEYVPPVFTVDLGRNPSIIDLPRAEISFFEYYTKEERGEFDGEVKTGFTVSAIR